MASVQDQFKSRANESAANINKTYDAGLSAQKHGLLDAYNANTQAQTQLGQQVQKTYETVGKDVGVQNARNTANLNQFADVRGVNRGTGSQQALNLGNATAQSIGAIDIARHGALQENERQKQMLTMNYNNQVTAALADNDYKRAAALLDDYKNQQQWQEQQAQILASYGNFDPYGELYGQNAANQARNVWLAQNPEVAYRTGAIDAETYKNITGKYPAGYTPPITGGGYYYGGYVPDDDGNGGPKTRDPAVQAKIDAQKLARSEKQIAQREAKAASAKTASSKATTTTASRPVTNWWFNSVG